MRKIMFVLAVLGAVTAAPAAAQQYPARSIRLIVPFVAGGSADVLSRVLAQRLTPLYGQQVVVENRPGSGGHVGAEAAARAAPDGYTIVFGTIGIHAAYGIYSKLNYDPARDLQAVALYADVPCILIVHPSVPAKNVREFIALAQKNPGRLNFGTAGSEVIEYWLDASMFSQWQKPLRKIPTPASVMQADLEYYDSLGFERHGFSFVTRF